MNIKKLTEITVLLLVLGISACYPLGDSIDDERPLSSDPEQSTDDAMSTDSTTECSLDYCNGHGACEVQDGHATCSCGGNWDPDTQCADCLAGYLFASNCFVCDAGYEERGDKCYEVCTIDYCNDQGTCDWDESGKRICTGCDGGLSEESLCKECSAGQEWHDLTLMCVDSCSDAYCNGVGVCSMTDAGNRHCACDSNYGDPTCGTEIPELTWVPIAGGAYNMGSIHDDADANEGPVHEVAVPEFELLKTEVTVAQYQKCQLVSECSVPDPGTGANQNWGMTGLENHPVNYVSWTQARSFCEWLGARLPTEAEWEFEARGGMLSRTYPWGDAAPTCSFAVMNDGALGVGCDIGRTWAVCSKMDGNSFSGLCDMAGNVWEWVEDDYHSTYSDAPTEGGIAWTNSPTRADSRVKRGGSFHNGNRDMRAAGRASAAPGDQTQGTGFRCAR